MRPNVFPTLAMLFMISSAHAQTVEADGSSKGAVVCSWMIYSAIQAQRDACGWEPLPADVALDEAVRDIEDFIVENSTVPVTLEELAASRERRANEEVDTCEFDPEDRTSWTAMAWAIRQGGTAEIQRGVADLLSVPREPVMNPCL